MALLVEKHILSFVQIPWISNVLTLTVPLNYTPTGVLEVSRGGSSQEFLYGVNFQLTDLDIVIKAGLAIIQVEVMLLMKGNTTLEVLVIGGMAIPILVLM